MPKHEPTEIYFYLERQLAKCMMRDDAFNFHVEPLRAEITYMQHILISHVCDSNKTESKENLAGENLLQVCSTDKSDS